MSMKASDPSLDNLTAGHSRPFAFRPSKLSAVTEKIWKKDGCSSNDNDSAHPKENLHLVDKPSIKCNQETLSSSDKNVASSSTSKSFVFGQKISERVIINDATKCSEVQPIIEPKINDFKSLQKSDENSEAESSSSSLEKTKLTLEESAKEYEETISANTKVKLAENVELKTGEEEESNILHFACKLHVFDAVKQSWEDRGGAMLRLNDGIKGDPDSVASDSSSMSKDEHRDGARIVVRLSGCLKLIVNSRLWDDMLVERVSQKRLKLSAIDSTDKNVILYLITASQAEIDRLEDILEEKLKKLRQRQKEAASLKRKQDENIAKLDKKLKVA